MTENEAIEWIKYLGNQKLPYDRSPKSRKLSCDIAIKALEEIQQYRAIGTVKQFEWCKEASHWKELFKDKLEQYEAIGTIEEFKALKEKSTPKKNNNDRELIRIANYYGFFNQKDIAIEELSELIQALSKLVRAKNVGYPTGVDVETARLNVIEELADVEITLYQLKYLLNINEDEIDAVKRNKINRTLERMGLEVEND